MKWMSHLSFKSLFRNNVIAIIADVGQAFLSSGDYGMQAIKLQCECEVCVIHFRDYLNIIV